MTSDFVDGGLKKAEPDPMDPFVVAVSTALDVPFK